MKPYRLSLKNGTFREGIIIQIGEGLGDIAPLPGFSRETLAEAEADIGQWTLPSTKFAYACAMRKRTPVKVAVNALDEYREGFKTVKLKMGNLSVEEAIAKIRTIPKGISIRLDFNRQWTLEKLLALASQSTDFEYWEEPTADFADLIQFSKLTGVPIAVDESIPYIPYWEIPTLKALVVKPTILGFIPTPPKDVELIFSSAFESGVGVSHIATLAAEHNPNGVHGLDPYTHFLEDVLENRPVIEAGYFYG